MTSRAAHGMRVWFGSEVPARMRIEAERRFPRETGGILVGFADETTAEIMVTAVVGPGPSARHGRWTFLPDHRYHEREVARLYNESGRIWTYLGDWHSHPTGSLALSLTDRRTLGRIARSKDARVARPIMIVIAGGSPTAGRGSIGDCVMPLGPWQVGAWRVDRTPSAWAANLGRVVSARCKLSVTQDGHPTV
jgi:integrative and conjugative element protein (TIGR02256 family)